MIMVMMLIRRNRKPEAGGQPRATRSSCAEVVFPFDKKENPQVDSMRRRRRRQCTVSWFAPNLTEIVSGGINSAYLISRLLRLHSTAIFSVNCCTSARSSSPPLRLGQEGEN